jgi:hypothetical protein
MLDESDILEDSPEPVDDIFPLLQMAQASYRSSCCKCSTDALCACYAIQASLSRSLFIL